MATDVHQTDLIVAVQKRDGVEHILSVVSSW